jgi:hypothetical protein
MTPIDPVLTPLTTDCSGYADSSVADRPPPALEGVPDLTTRPA